MPRRHPDAPVVAVGVLLLDGDRVLLVQRAEPLEGRGDPALHIGEREADRLRPEIEAEEAGKGHTLNRLAVYAAAVTDDSVPEGWVRLNLRSAA